MHVFQWIAIQSEDKNQAFLSVKGYLETAMGNEDSYASWYDWFVTGGGRWNPNEGSQYDDNDQSMVISYDEEPKKFLEAVEQSMENRKEEFDRYAKDVNADMIAKVISDYNPRQKLFAAFQGLYPIKKLIDMAYGEWDYNSYFFDCHHDTATPAYMLESIDTGNKNWYLIPVDFHF
jgi:hypothetical protein